jgi:hypothetical protein
VWDLIGDAAAVPAESVLPLEQAGGGRMLIDATEQRVARPGDDGPQRRYDSGKQEHHTLKTRVVTDADHHVRAISTAVPGATHDKPRCDGLHTLDRVPDGIAAAADKGDQGRAAQVETVAVCDVAQPMRSSSARAWPPRPHRRSHAAGR